VGVPERIVVQLGAPVVLQTDVVANQDAEMQAARLELTATVNQANAHVKLPVHVPVNISVHMGHCYGYNTIPRTTTQ